MHDVSLLGLASGQWGGGFTILRDLAILAAQVLLGICLGAVAARAGRVLRTKPAARLPALSVLVLIGAFYQLWLFPKLLTVAVIIVQIFVARR